MSIPAGHTEVASRQTQDDRVYTYTVSVTEDEAVAMARGEMPAAVQNSLISLLISVQEPPAVAVQSMARRRARTR